MEKYPANITEKENAKLKYPFLPTQQYDKINVLPDGPVVLIRFSKDKKLTKTDIVHMAKINRSIMAHRIIKEQDKTLSGKRRC